MTRYHWPDVNAIIVPEQPRHRSQQPSTLAVHADGPTAQRIPASHPSSHPNGDRFQPPPQQQVNHHQPQPQQQVNHHQPQPHNQQLQPQPHNQQLQPQPHNQQLQQPPHFMTDEDTYDAPQRKPDGGVRPGDRRRPSPSDAVYCAPQKEYPQQQLLQYPPQSHPPQQPYSHRQQNHPLQQQNQQHHQNHQPQQHNQQLLQQPHFRQNHHQPHQQSNHNEPQQQPQQQVNHYQPQQHNQQLQPQPHFRQNHHQSQPQVHQNHQPQQLHQQLQQQPPHRQTHHQWPPVPPQPYSTDLVADLQADLRNVRADVSALQEEVAYLRSALSALTNNGDADSNRRTSLQRPLENDANLAGPSSSHSRYSPRGDPNVRLCNLCNVEYQHNIVAQHFDGKRHKQHLLKLVQENNLVELREQADIARRCGVPMTELYYGCFAKCSPPDSTRLSNSAGNHVTLSPTRREGSPLRRAVPPLRIGGW